MSQGLTEGAVAVRGAPAVARRVARHAAPRQRTLGTLGDTLRFPATMFGLSRGILVLLAAVVPMQAGQAPLGWLGRLVGAADAGWYLSIAQGGYSHVPFSAVHGQVNWVFYPLFPVSTRVIANLLGASVLWTGVVLANACFLAFTVVLYRWVARDWNPRTARIAVALACFCPVGAYFTEFRAASLFLLLSTWSLERIARRRMGQAAVLGALATLARPTGVLLALPYALACFDLARRPGTRRRGLLALGLGPLFAAGPLVMAWVSQADAGTPLAFVKAQIQWGRQFRPPLAAFVPFFRQPTMVSDWGWSSPPIAIAAAALGLAGAAYLWRRRAPAGLAVYLGATVLAASASTVLLGFPRFVAEASPLYIAGGLAPKRVGLALVVLSAAAMVVYTVWWLLGAHWTMA